MRSTAGVGLRSRLVPIVLLLCVLSCLLGFSLAAMAYNASIANNLNRSRDALLDQRAHLKQAANDIGGKIDALQRQLDIVNSYLRDNDRAIRDVENALRQAE